MAWPGWGQKIMYIAYTFTSLLGMISSQMSVYLDGQCLRYYQYLMYLGVTLTYWKHLTKTKLKNRNLMMKLAALVGELMHSVSGYLLWLCVLSSRVLWSGVVKLSTLIWWIQCDNASHLWYTLAPLHFHDFQTFKHWTESCYWQAGDQSLQHEDWLTYTDLCDLPRPWLTSVEWLTLDVTSHWRLNLCSSS